jgi:hypothetical protein
MILPNAESKAIKSLSHAFDDTTATYKFFWFISILQILATEQRDRIYVKDIMAHMVANAWYPVHYFKLSFGNHDKLFETVVWMQEHLGITIDATVDEVVENIKMHAHERDVKQRLMDRAKYVPYRFLNPWLNSQDNTEIVARSQRFEEGCPYGIFQDKGSREQYIRINPAWEEYLLAHYLILKDFAYWRLTLYLQARNPNVPAIPDKLTRSLQRESLTKQRAYWNRVIELSGPLHCIYTGRELVCKEYDLDHFIPWSFVSHDLLWNLIPADPSINSSKGNRLPNLTKFLPQLAKMQQDSLKVVVRQGSRLKILDDYLSLGYTPTELAEMNSQRFRNIFERTFVPIHQIALNMGFEAWTY